MTDEPIATIIDRPPTRDSPRSLAGSVAPASTVTSPLDALHHAEIRGTRGFCRVAIAIGIGVFAIVPLLPGHPITGPLFMAAIAISVAALLYLYRRTSDPVRYYEGLGTAAGWYIPSLGVACAVPYFGPFSPVGIALVLGIYFNALGASFRLSLAVYLTCALGHGVSGALVIAKLVDPGFIHVDDLSLSVQIIGQVLVQVVLVGTFLVARGSRRSSLAALTELERAVRTVAQREALLDEAREELRRAAGSGRGRFTDQQFGRWKLGDLIGRGAMGEVYDARDTATDQEVAVKMLSAASLSNAHYVHRFMRELQTAASISSPNVVNVIEVGEQPLPHLVMERLRGRDLGEILRGRVQLSHEKIVDLIRQVGIGITAAGALGVIHRDLKPQNVFLAGSTWKILDFGVSRVTDGGDTLTSGQVVGTPAYMAPEQARGTTVDHRTDLYALAAIAYRTLTGHAPFSGGELPDLLYRVVYTPPRRPTSLAPVHPDVDLVLAIGLAKDANDRFTSANELADALAAALAGTLGGALRARGEVIASAWAAPPLAVAKRAATARP